MKLLALICAALVGAASAANYPRTEAALRDFDEHVAGMRAAFAKLPGDAADKTWVKAKLQHMVDVDQYARAAAMSPGAVSSSPAEQAELQGQLARRVLEIDSRNIQELKPLLQKYGWFTIREFDSNADRNAWLLIQHADSDPELQRRLLQTLEPLTKTGETSPRNFAYLFDRVAVSVQNPKGRELQRFGTQGQCSGPGTWEPHPVEDPASLDERRRAAGLEPIAEYRLLFKDLCRESTDETLRKLRESAGTQAAP
jgi:hypothetical protein